MRQTTLGRCLLAAASLLGCAVPVFATTKGYNQIVTPDIQPAGVLSLSFQAQHAAIGNQNELQYELGITRRFELAFFQGFSPPDNTLSVEYGLVQQKRWLLSTGMLSFLSGSTRRAPFLEAGFYQDRAAFVVGVLRTRSHTQPLAGIGYQVTPRLLLAADYQQGTGNFATLGFTYAVTRRLSLNPAIYVTNATPRRAFPYVVLTWNIQAWKPKRQLSNPVAIGAPVCRLETAGLAPVDHSEPPEVRPAAPRIPGAPIPGPTRSADTNSPTGSGTPAPSGAGKADPHRRRARDR